MARLEDELAIASMMADLGLARREDISTPHTDGRGNAFHRSEAAQDAEIASILAKHQQKVQENADGNGHDSAVVKAWNRKSSLHCIFTPVFHADTRTVGANTASESDTCQLQNRWSGQGHRAMMKRDAGADDEFESLVNKFGEERAMWMLERRRAGTAVSTASFHARQMHPALRPTPSRQKADLPISQQRARAPSPRASGTVRWVNGRRDEDGPLTPVRPQHDGKSGTASRQASTMQIVNAGRPHVPALDQRPTKRIEVDASSQRKIPAQDPSSIATTSIKDQEVRVAISNPPIKATGTSTCFVEAMPATLTATSSESSLSKTEEPKRSSVRYLTPETLFAPVSDDLRYVDVIDVAKHIFHPLRAQWLQKNPHLVTALANIGGAIREEMMRIARLPCQQPDALRFCRLFDFIEDISDHLEAARKALADATHPAERVKAYYEEKSQHQPFFAMAMAQMRAEEESNVNDSQSIGAASESSEDDTPIPAGRSTDEIMAIQKRFSTDHVAQIGGSVTATSDHVLDAEISELGNEAIIGGPRRFMKDDLVESLESLVCTTLKRSELLDGITKRGGIYFMEE